MPYLIDGHNLIGAMADIDLSDPDDELQLLQLLENFTQSTGRRLEVHFDRRALGRTDPPSQGRMQIHFTGTPRTADQAITARLAQLGGDAKNWTVVSSDRAVQAAARHQGAKVLSSQQFAKQLRTSRQDSPPTEKPDVNLDQDELDAWERLFQGEDES